MNKLLDTSLARGTRPWTVVTTDQANVDMLRTTVSETPEMETVHIKYNELSVSSLHTTTQLCQLKHIKH